MVRRFITFLIVGACLLALSQATRALKRRHDRLQSLQLLEAKASTSVEAKWVIGGDNVPQGLYEYAAGFYTEHLLHVNHCSGSLIYDRFILTAAHCVTNDNWNDVKVWHGARMAFFQGMWPTGKTEIQWLRINRRAGVPVRRFWEIGSFTTARTAADDLAIFELAAPLSVFGYTFKPSPLPDTTKTNVWDYLGIHSPEGSTGTSTNTVKKVDEVFHDIGRQTLGDQHYVNMEASKPVIDERPECDVVGFGGQDRDGAITLLPGTTETNDNPGRGRGNLLRNVTMRLMSTRGAYCKDSMKTYFCMEASYTRDSCHGDSGGPILTMHGGKQVQVGVTIVGSPTCAMNVPNGNQDVIRHLSWIKNTVKRADADATVGGAMPGDIRLLEAEYELKFWDQMVKIKEGTGSAIPGQSLTYLEVLRYYKFVAELRVAHTKWSNAMASFLPSQMLARDTLKAECTKKAAYVKKTKESISQVLLKVGIKYDPALAYNC